MSKVKLFEKVKCKAYLKEIHDGVRMQIYDPSGNDFGGNRVPNTNYKAIAYKENNKIADLSEYDGSAVDKVYRERVETEFKGVIVGYTYLTIKGRIGTDWYDDPYFEYGYCYKLATERPLVGIVYFKNNAKRYVLIEDMEKIEDEVCSN